MSFNGETHRWSTAELTPNTPLVAVTVPFPILLNYLPSIS